MKGRRVLITAGPTYEKIDPVRFIGNFSSGKQGFALALECAERGAQVTLVAGPVSLAIDHPGVNRIDVTSADEMHRTVLDNIECQDVAIMCAAVADYKVENELDHKIKREKGDAPTLVLVKNPDIAKAVGTVKKPGQVLVGFALETDNEDVYAHEKLAKKNLDFIVLNSLKDKGAGFQVDTNKVKIIESDGSETIFPCKDKRMVAKDIVDLLNAKYLKS